MIINKQKDGTYKLTLNPDNYNINKGVVDKKDMFLYDKKKTIGFRKDKKLEKFVGLRDGYPRQLELSLRSIIIDGNELISSRRVNFSSIELDNDKVLHTFNNIHIINEVDSSNFKNIVKIEDYFEHLEIIYEVHIKGLRLINRLSGNKYISNNDDQYIFVSNKDNTKKFIINKPFVLDNEYRYLEIIEDKLYIENDKLYYKKIITNDLPEESIDFPLYIDANIIFNLSNYGHLIKNINTSNNAAYTWHRVVHLNDTYTFLNYLDSMEGYVKTYWGSTKSYRLSRCYLSFDTTNIDKNLIYKVELEVNTYDSDTSFIIQKGTFGNTLSTTADWLSFTGSPYGEFDASVNNNIVIDLGQQGIDDLVEGGFTKYVIRQKQNDYEYVYTNPYTYTNLPPLGWSFNIGHNWTYKLNIYVYDLIQNRMTFNFPINEFDFGVMKSSASDWNTTINGNNVNIINDDINNEFGESVGVRRIGSNYELNRTFLSFDTSSIFNYKSVTSSVRLKLDNYMENNEGIVVLKSDYNNLSISDWDNISTFYTGTTLISNGFETNFDLPLSSLNITGNTNLSLLSYHDYYNNQPTSDIDSFSGIDFDNTVLEVILEPMKVYGKTYYNVKKGDYFELEAFTNYSTRDHIMWYRDPEYTQLVNIGPSFIDYSIEYDNNNKIYAILILDDNFNTSTTLSPQTSMTTTPLIITVNINSIDYPLLPVKYPNYNAIDIDSVYYKFNKCISGVCYTYVRDINDAYEGFPLVSNNWGNNSYNLYNEFDIIDEFFSNTHEVEVAYNQNLDLSKRYNDLDGIILREGTRVLLMAQNDVTELGVYVSQYDHKLIKTDEMNTYNKVFRYKAHVNAGTYADQEIHVWPILPPPAAPSIEGVPNPVTFIYNSGVTQTVQIISNTSWTIYNKIPWLSINKSDGVGNDSVILRTTKENLTGNIRTGEIEFTGFGGATMILVVIQDAFTGLDYRATTDGDIRITSDNDNRIII